MTNGKRYPRIRVHYVDSPKVDARAMPGGALFFFRGLLDAAESEAALVGIVGHELSHLDRGHLLLPLRRQKLMSGEAWPDDTGRKSGKSTPHQPAAVADFFAGVSALRVVARPFHPEDEAEADADGAAWAYASGYDPRETARLWERLAAKSNDPKVPFADFFRTHPHGEDRAASLMRQYDALQAAQPRADLYRGCKNLADRVAKSQQTFPE
jgi:predicted Zn-dependent protease